MKRGDVVTVAIAGDYGKPRPAVVVQSDLLDETDSVLVCLITSTERDAPFYRFAVSPTPDTGLRGKSDVMVDKVVAVRRNRVGARIGALDQAAMLVIGRLLALVLGLAD